MATRMSDDQRRAFLAHGTRTGILSTTRKDGRPHAAPVWFVLDGDDIVFTTGADTVKGRTLRRTGQAHLTVDDPTPPYAFVAISGRVELRDELDEMLVWATLIGERYMGPRRAEYYGRRNAVHGELLVRLSPDHVVAFSGIAD
jgi:PPOX class probable F420-dependent enzyme